MDHGPRPEFNIEVVDDVTIVTLLAPRIVTEIDVSSVSDQLFHLARSSESPNLLLNCSRLRTMSSSLLGKLVQLNKLVQTSGGRVKLCCLAPGLQEAFQITLLDQVLPIHADSTEALLAFSSLQAGSTDLEEQTSTDEEGR